MKEAVATVEDLARAGQGDLPALRRLRDYWFQVATGDVANPLLPKDEAIPQLELLAHLAAAGSGDVDDQVVLLAAYQVRIRMLERNVEASEGLAREAVEAKDAVALERWSASVVEFNDRLGSYRADMKRMMAAVLHDGEAEGAAMLVGALTLQADNGDERALGMLQCVMDSVTPARASAIKAEVLRIEGATVQ